MARLLEQLICSEKEGFTHIEKRHMAMGNFSHDERAAFICLIVIFSLILPF